LSRDAGRRREKRLKKVGEKAFISSHLRIEIGDVETAKGAVIKRKQTSKKEG